MRVKTLILFTLLLVAILPVISIYANFTQGRYYGTEKGVMIRKDFTTGYRYIDKYTYEAYWDIRIDRETQTLYLYGSPLHIRHIRESSRYIFINAVEYNRGTLEDGNYYVEKYVVTLILYGENYIKCRLSYHYQFSERDADTGRLLYVEVERGVFTGEYFETPW